MGAQLRCCSQERVALRACGPIVQSCSLQQHLPCRRTTQSPELTLLQRSHPHHPRALLARRDPAAHQGLALRNSCRHHLCKSKLLGDRPGQGSARERGPAPPCPAGQLAEDKKAFLRLQCSFGVYWMQQLLMHQAAGLLRHAEGRFKLPPPLARRCWGKGLSLPFMCVQVA